MAFLRYLRDKRDNKADANAFILYNALVKYLESNVRRYLNNQTISELLINETDDKDLNEVKGILRREFFCHFMKKEIFEFYIKESKMRDEFKNALKINREIIRRGFLNPFERVKFSY